MYSEDCSVYTVDEARLDIDTWNSCLLKSVIRHVTEEAIPKFVYCFRLRYGIHTTKTCLIKHV